ncbi:hypothetical protein AUJ42_01480 [Candidatus Collierbacteria bacterium CG1_02_44_10]|uniref:Type II toxin-antitoxin system mRNA interferase toxin, RelE/StbE family n=3 Tax=Candidatus Collieribacteriota TaxID=1752725 RepID=A0A2H0DTN1_9BACT|nr:type II toxin-antitoxin system RelE/ParE family toxin [bacterium]OIN91674.1 MAG: hypothetical protein AUJ42_01480 [Candidatus Collierbacteria bacterium CG1_02_44_10]PIP85218.1 MAG: type II toxin-antitoxin system mRNA interferase toxin, RelE/StbE family [Candidatus Collierbacteria bacterium CG22_combo_CG10-13_8_21_14_all_43_12]PIZ24401.1 MAG: type II toxin-antitoxin system RelE/ParE family toxin [Candidatus Collierbacteria bacterium CG_4_10_14_0_8_um_filter_43_86]PJB47952.1 MAG: type II toxin
MNTYRFTKRALKDLSDLPKNKQLLIINKLEYFTSTGKPLSFAKNLTNFSLGQYRFRVGDYRITFDLDSDSTIYILHIGHRREIYK